MYFSSMNRLPARAVALFGYVDPVSALIFSAIFLHESMGPVQLLGAALVFAGAAGARAGRRRSGPRADAPPGFDTFTTIVYNYSMLAEVTG